MTLVAEMSGKTHQHQCLLAGGPHISDPDVQLHRRAP